MNTQDAKAVAAARGIKVTQIPPEHGHLWVAIIPRKGRGEQVPLARMLGDSEEAAARAALVYVGARGWWE